MLRESGEPGISKGLLIGRERPPNQTHNGDWQMTWKPQETDQEAQPDQDQLSQITFAVLKQVSTKTTGTERAGTTIKPPKSHWTSTHSCKSRCEDWVDVYAGSVKQSSCGAGIYVAKRPKKDTVPLPP
jgi:hypothetical protein